MRKWYIEFDLQRLCLLFQHLLLFAGFLQITGARETEVLQCPFLFNETSLNWKKSSTLPFMKEKQVATWKFLVLEFVQVEFRFINFWAMLPKTI